MSDRAGAAEKDRPWWAVVAVIEVVESPPGLADALIVGDEEDNGSGSLAGEEEALRGGEVKAPGDAEARLGCPAREAQEFTGVGGRNAGAVSGTSESKSEIGWGEEGN